MADEIKLKAPTVEQQVVVNINGEEKLRSFADTLDKISNNKNLQKYWKTEQELINATTDAYDNFQKKASKDNATELIKVTNALKAVSNTDLSNILPDFDKISKAMAEAQKLVGNIDSAFSVKGFKEAFESFETLKAYSEDIEKIFSHFSVSSDVSELQNTVRVLESEVEKLTRKLTSARNINEELRNEFENYKTGSGLADTLDELDNLKYEVSNLREQAEETFNQFLKLNNITKDGYDREGFYNDNRFKEYFQNIQSGYWSASVAIQQFKQEYSYLLDDNFKSNNDTFGLEQLQAFSNKLDSIFRQVEETSTKINDIISNGVITKSVENLSMDSSLSDSQRSLFGNLLQDEESLKSITALFQKLVEESNKTSKVDLFNDEQLQKVLSIFDKIENHLSSLRSIISDVGDGEEFSPLLKTINDVQKVVSNLEATVSKIKLNVNIETKGSDEQLLAKIEQRKQVLLNAYRDQFNAMRKIKPSGADILNSFGLASTSGSTIAALNKSINMFDESEIDNIDQKISAYEDMIKKMKRLSELSYGTNIYDNMDKTFQNKVSSAKGSLTKAMNSLDNDISDGLGGLFGQTDLSGVISQLEQIVKKLEEISSSATEFKNIFKEGFNIADSVEEINKLTDRVKELEDELSKIKSNSVDINKPNISSETQIEDVFQGGTTSAEKLEEEIKNIDSATEKASESAKEYRKILSQVGEFDVDSKVSAMYKRNDGQLESWTWRAKKDDEGNVLYDQNGKIDYDEPTITVISKYEQLEKIIVKADNELRNLQKDLAEIKAYDPTASTTNIETKISDQKEYIRLLEQTVKVISQSDEYLLDEQQIIEARNKAAREYALTTGAKQEKTDAKQSASDEKKRLANIEQVNRALNKQQITIDAIEKTYNKTTNPDLDREVSNQQDLAELAQKKLAIQNKINSLQGKERNSANEKEFLELEKLIAEYKELAKYKLKANNPSKQELGGQNLQTLIQVQISNYDKLITKAEKYGDATSDTVEKLKEQRDILSKIDSDGKYSATADQYYASRDTYKVESAALSAFEAETKAAEQEAKAQQQLTEAMAKGREQSEILRKQEEKRQQIAQDNAINKALEKEYQQRQKNIQAAEKQKELDREKALNFTQNAKSKLLDAVAKYSYGDTSDAESMITQMNSGVLNFGDLSDIDGVIVKLSSSIDSIISDLKRSHEESLKGLKAEIKAEADLQNQKDSFNKKNINAIDLEIQQREESAKAYSAQLKSQMQERENYLANIQSDIDKYNQDFKNRDVKPINQNRSVEYQKALDNYKASILLLQQEKERLANLPFIEEKDLAYIEQLKNTIEANALALKQMSAAQKGSTEGSRRKEIDKINKYLAENTRLSKEAKQELQALVQTLESGDPSVNVEKIHNRFLQLSNSERLAGNEGQRFLDVLKDKVWYSWAAQIGAYFSFSDIIRYISNGVTVVTELDTALTEMRKVSDETVTSLRAFQNVSFDVAKQVGTTALSIQNSAADFMRLGYSLNEATKLSKDANIYANVGDMDISEATEHMVSSIQAWQSEFDSATEASTNIIDRYNEVGNRFAITSADIGSAMERSAAALKAGGNTLNESIGLITAGNLIQQDADTTANALKVMSLRIRGAKADLEDMGESTDDLADSTSKLREQIKGLTGVDIMIDNNTFKSTAEIIKEIGAQWSKLTDVSKASTLETLAGKTRASTVAGLIENYKTIDLVIKTAENSENSARLENEKYIDSIEGRLNLLQSQAQKLAFVTIDSNALKVGITLLTKLVELITNIVDEFGVATPIVAGFVAAFNLGESKQRFCPIW